jgi:hypothetical protein
MKMKINRTNDRKFLNIFQIHSNPYGQSYVKWTEKWWQWVFSIRKVRNPVIDKSGERCCEGQDGPVWFLAGTSGGEFFAERSCSIPSEKSILFPIIVSQYSLAEKPAMSIQELVRYTATDIEQTSFLEAIVDGMMVTDLPKYRIQSRFRLDFVEDNIWNLKAGPTEAVSDGFWVFLKPLPKGKHTIIFRGIEPNFKTKVSYGLTIF